MKAFRERTTKEKSHAQPGPGRRFQGAHDELDAAVLLAYGWDDLAPTLRQAQGERGQAQSMTDTLTRLVALCAQRAVEEKGRPHPLATPRILEPAKSAKPGIRPVAIK